MQNLKRANGELVRRSPDERFTTLTDLWQHCQGEKEASEDRWVQPGDLTPLPDEGRLDVALEDGSRFSLNDCSKIQVWANETAQGVRHNVTFSRLYRDGDEWKTSDSFGRDDVLILAKVADQAHTWIFEQSQQEAGGKAAA